MNLWQLCNSENFTVSVDSTFKETELKCLR